MSRIPFSEAELSTDSFYPPMFPGFPLQKKYKTPVTPKENYRMFYRREVPYWIPTVADMLMLASRVDPDNLARCTIVEANMLKPEEMVGGKDKFGVEWVYVEVAGGALVKPGNPILSSANEWPEKIKFPDVDSWDWEGCAKANASYIDPERFLSVTILSGFFERLISFMDFENAAVALIDEEQKDSVHSLFSALADLYIKMIDKYIEYFNIDIIQLHDDWGSQRASFFSLNTAMEMIVPYIKRVVDHAHEKGVFYDQHSCGKNDKLVPAYIAAGIDSWNGQDINDKKRLYEQYSDKLIFGIEPDLPSNPDFSPVDLSEEEVIAGAKRFVDGFGPNFPERPVLGGFFMGPSIYGDTLYSESRKLFDKIAEERQ